MADWVMPSLAGRSALVTGATSGIGLAAAVALAKAGASVILTARDATRGDAALGAVRAAAPSASVRLERLDLARLDDVRALAERLGDAPLDMLLLNAGVMMPPARVLTADGFELTFGTNHLGHFALALLLMPALLRAPAPRIVAISSLAAAQGRIDPANLNAERSYSAFGAYAQSKLANLMFALALAERAADAGSPLVSLAAHPGFSLTNLANASGRGAMFRNGTALVARLLGQAPPQGALPGLRALTEPQAAAHPYWGPSGVGGLRGAPVPVKVPASASSRPLRDRLWTASERLTGVVMPSL